MIFARQNFTQHLKFNHVFTILFVWINMIFISGWIFSLTCHLFCPCLNNNKINLNLCWGNSLYKVIRGRRLPWRFLSPSSYRGNSAPHAPESLIPITEPSRCSDVYPPPVIRVFLTPVKSLKLVNLHPLLPDWLKHTPWNNTHTHAHTLRQVSGIECRCRPTVGARCVAPDVLRFRFDLFSMTCWSEQLRLFVFTAVMWHLNPPTGKRLICSALRQKAVI